MPGEYGGGRRERHGAAVGLLAALSIIMGMLMPAAASARTVKLVALGDSLTAGFGLQADAAFPAVLEKALQAKGHDVTVANAGVSGETSSDGLARVDWSVADGTDGVIVELGANDMLRGLDPSITDQALTQIVTRLQKRGIKVLLAGMLSVTDYGTPYKTSFDAIYPALSRQFGVPLYRFFLHGIAHDPKYNLPDGLHPNPFGVKVIVQNILPSVETLLKQIGP